MTPGLKYPVGEFAKAARLCPKVCGQNVKRWEDWIFVFAQKGQIDVGICTLTCSTRLMTLAGHNPLCANRESQTRPAGL